MIYLCLQPNPFRYQIWVRELKKRLDPDMADFNFQRFDGTKVSAMEVADAAAAMPMMSDVRIVEVEGLLDHLRAILHKGGSERQELARAERKELLAVMQELPAETILVFLEPASSRAKDWRSRFGSLGKPDLEMLAELKVEQKLELVPLRTPEKKELVNWIEQRGTEKGLSCTMDAMWVLGQRVGHDLQLLEMEMDKLAAYANGEQLTVQIVEEMVTDYREEPIWQLADAVFSQSRRKAMTSLAHLEAQGFTPYHILGTLSSQLRVIAAVKMSHTTDDVIATALRVHPYAVRMAYGRANRFSRDQILYFCDLVQEADYAMKSQAHPEQTLEILIGRMVTPAMWEPA